MVRAAKQWPWSSYRATAGLAELSGGLNTEWLLAGFAKRKSVAVKRYIEFIKDGKNQPSPWEHLTNQVFLGTEEFVAEVRKHIPNDKDISEVSSSQKRPVAKPISSYVAQAEDRIKQ